MVGKTGREGPGGVLRGGDSHEGESADGGRGDGRKGGGGQLATRESIGKIVKHEMKKILQVCVPLLQDREAEPNGLGLRY